MKLVAVIIVWDDWELVYCQIEHFLKHKMVDDVLVIFSEYSNYGEFSEFIFKDYNIDYEGKKVELIQWEPDSKNVPRENETNKRNFGLIEARNRGFTHFLILDADEFYEPEPFLKAKERFLNEPNLAGLVCQCQTYFKSPQLTIGLDTTLVPFIHKLTPTIKHEFNKQYPFAWINGQIRIDPTRSLNISSGVERTDLIMHHMSWIRRDYEKKIRNSTARRNLERSSIRNDLVFAKEGYFVEFYQRHLQRSSVDFGIPEFHEHNESDNPALC